MARRIELAPHDPAWVALAERERARLRAVLGAALHDVLHVGSTAIEGVRAKPVVDLIPVVTSLDALDVYRADVEALSYEWLGEFGIADRRHCVLFDPSEPERRLVHLHAFAIGSEQIARHVRFRDYLRAHPADARAYEAVKQRARDAFPDDGAAYNEAKGEWIRECDLRALRWVAGG